MRKIQYFLILQLLIFSLTSCAALDNNAVTSSDEAENNSADSSTQLY